MRCIIPGVNLKVFGRSIHSLAKIGDELYFEPLEQGLSLRTVNSARSAYACFLFFPSYFLHYDDSVGHQAVNGNDEEEEEEGLRCKINMKSIMAVFRSLSTIEKTVEKCKISHNAREARLVFELYCRHGIVKTHNLTYVECDTLQAIFSKDMCPNKLTAPSKLFCDVVVNFQTTQEEITMGVRPDSLSLKNYVEEEADPTKVVHTELSLAPEEFDQYQVGVDTDITFCLKELRAILAFGETCGLPLGLNFEAAGRPVTFCIDSDQTFEANFVLATLAEVDQSSQAVGSQRPRQPTSTAKHRTSKAGGRGKDRARGAGDGGKSSDKAEQRKGLSNGDHQGSRTHPQPPQEEASVSERTTDSRSLEGRGVAEQAGPSKGNPSHAGSDTSRHKDTKWGESPENTSSDGWLNKSGMPSIERRRGGGRTEEEGERMEGEEDGDRPASASSSSPVIPVQCPASDSKYESRTKPCLQPLDSEEDDLDDTIPGTPPAKKFRSLFFGSSQKESQPPASKVVLAADTDDED